MNNLFRNNENNIYLITLLIIIIIFGGFYFYFWAPYVKEINFKEEEAINLEKQTYNINLDNKKQIINNLEEELKINQAVIKEIENEKTISLEEKEEILMHIGKEIRKLNLNLIKYEENPSEKISSYDIVSYNLKIQGENNQLIEFLNSLYSKYNYFYIDNIDMRIIEYKPSFQDLDVDKVTNQRQGDFIDHEVIRQLFYTIPPELEMNENEQLEIPSINKLQLVFDIYFIMEKASWKY